MFLLWNLENFLTVYWSNVIRHHFNSSDWIRRRSQTNFESVIQTISFAIHTV